MEADYDNPESVVMAFITEMNSWELDAHKAQRACRGTNDPDSYRAGVWEKQAEIFKRYVTPRDRPRGRYHFSNPPEYNPATERLVESGLPEGGRKAFVITERTSVLAGGLFHYSLVRQSDKLLIDNLKREYDGRTSQHIL